MVAFTYAAGLYFYRMQFPPGFIDSLRGLDGFSENSFIEAHATQPPVSVRINTNKAVSLFTGCEAVPWCSDAYYLDKRPVFTLDPAFHAGAYYVQEASSMFLDHVIRSVTDVQQPLRILDLCAAPGGKSTLIASAISANSLLVSNEVIRSRVNVLKENLIKWGNSNCVITNNDPGAFARLENYFDLIVIDAPCSGSGLFRKDAAALKEWSEENVMLCSKRQSRIVEDVLPALKKDGILIYSTCSYSAEEDERIVQKLVSQDGFELIHIPFDPSWGIIETSYGLRFYPDKVKGEGFFISALKKKQEIKNTSFHEYKPGYSKEITADKNILQNYLRDAEAYNITQRDSFITALPLHLKTDVEYLHANLKVIKAGILCGEIKGKDLIPSHELALSDCIAHHLPAIDVDKGNALQYLRKQEMRNIKFPGNEIKGWCIIRYHDLNLGWIKILENRINNYYPTEWRIRNL